MLNLHLRKFDVPTKTMTTFWLVAASLCTSMGWLLPNNFPPWLSFHKEAWAAVSLLIVSGWVLIRHRENTDLHVLPLVVAICATIPLLQHVAGLIPLFGDAWIQSLYLLGFFLALQVGEKWERETAGQCADFLFLAIGVASVVSTGIQLHQWLALKTEAALWMLGNGTPNRYYANLAQANLLSSLLLMGVLACFWAYYRQKLAGWVASLAAVFILLGVVLAGSRTAWVTIFLLTVATFLLRKRMPAHMKVWVAPALAGYFYFLALAMPTINRFLAIPEHDFSLELRGIQDSARLDGWRMLLDASTLQPWLGFGWGQVTQATFSVVAQYPVQQGIFRHAHNLVLDLILWNGYPLGLALAAFLAWWVWRVLSQASQIGQYAVIAALVVIGIHAMLEFPLTYVYFLMPLGLLLGTLNTSLGFRPVVVTNAWCNVALWAAIVAGLSVSVRDYLRVETSFYGLRFENRGIPSPIPKTPPDVIVLTQWRDVIAFSRNVPRGGLSDAELEHMRGIVKTVPTPLTMNRLAANLAMNHLPEEAFKWLTIGCKTYPEFLCRSMEARWRQEAASNPQMAVVPWPKVTYKP